MSANNSDDLFDEVKKAASDKLASGVEKVDKLGQEDYEERIRATDFGLEQHWKFVIGPRFQWVKYRLIVSVLVFLVICAVILVIKHITHIWGSPTAIASLLNYVFEMALVALSTLFVDSRLRKK